MIKISVVFIVLIVVVLTIIIGFTFLLYRNFADRIIREKNKAHLIEIQHQKKLLQESVKAQEEEREQIAIRLHDDIGNKLNVLSVWLNNPNAWNSERSKEIILKQIPDLIETTRNISHSLYPVNLERFGLIQTIEDLVNNIEESLKIRLTITSKYQPRNISVEVQIYRIIQEFLSNVLKHSQATTMHIYLRDSSNSLSLILADNGKGFDVNAIKKGMGVRNIELRASSMNATFKWKSTISKGCRIIISLPKHG